jgi:hypothetical protein
MPRTAGIGRVGKFATVRLAEYQIPGPVALFRRGRPTRLALPPWALGRQAESNVALSELETKYADGSSYDIADVYAYWGETDSAFHWLDCAYRRHDPGMLDVRTDPLLQNLRKDPRYQAVVVKMRVDGDPPVPPH